MTKHVVGFSGGIDSQACARWVLNRYPSEDVILLNSEAGRNEHPLTVEFVGWYSASIHPVVQVVPLIRDLGIATGNSKYADRREELSEDDELTFERLAYLKGGFPSKTRQFCTEYLKLRPANRWIEENLGEYEIIRYSGRRRDESKDRAGLCFIEWDKGSDCELRSPIADWTKEMCFAFCKSHGEKINQLYEMGFNRVGCAPCIGSNKDDILNWATRFPEMIDKIRGWEKYTGKTFFAPFKVPGKRIASVDEVVEWSKTAHGGKKIMLPFAEADAASGECVSKYGLCG